MTTSSLHYLSELFARKFIFLGRGQNFWLELIYSEKATKFCELSTSLLSYVVTVKNKLEISQNFVAFSEYMNFKLKLDKYYLLFRRQGCFPFKSQCVHGHWRNCKGRFDISSGKFEKTLCSNVCTIEFQFFANGQFLQYLWTKKTVKLLFSMT